MSKAPEHKDHNEIGKAWTEKYRNLYEFLDRDPQAAIDAASRLQPCRNLDQANIDMLRACIYVDAGQAIGDVGIVRKATAILRRCELAEPESHAVAYNFANALHALSPLTQIEGRPWHLVTSGLCRVARQLYERAAGSPDSSLASQAKTNQGNLLMKADRWVEAYDCYAEALRRDHRNGVAALRMAQMLLRFSKLGLGPKAEYRQLAGAYLAQAKAVSVQTGQYGGKKAVEEVRHLLDSEYPSGVPAKPRRLDVKSHYLRFVLDNRLLLSLDMACCLAPASRWDSLLIPSVVESVSVPFGVPPIFAMFNMLKADFVASRWLAYIATEEQVPETGNYSDTLDYAKYGVTQSLILAAQRSAIDLLDRVAVAASEHFGLPGAPEQIHFVTRWHKRQGRKLALPIEWIPKLESEIQSGNSALIAIAELAEDMMKGGYLKPQKSLRNESTHRFVVLHDMGASANRETPFIRHYNEDEFRDETITALRIARAAILYLREAIRYRESRRMEESDGLVVRLDVYPHHFIRGESDNEGVSRFEPH